MCLAVPGRIIEAPCDDGHAAVGDVVTVDFQGTRANVSVVLTPEARPGDWVLVHAGFALHVLDEREAMEIWAYLEGTDRVDTAGGEAEPSHSQPGDGL